MTDRSERRVKQKLQKTMSSFCKNQPMEASDGAQMFKLCPIFEFKGSSRKASLLHRLVDRQHQGWRRESGQDEDVCCCCCWMILKEQRTNVILPSGVITNPFIIWNLNRNYFCFVSLLLLFFLYEKVGVSFWCTFL